MKKLLAIAFLVGNPCAMCGADVATQEFRITVPQSVEVAMQVEKMGYSSVVVPSNDSDVTWLWSFQGNAATSIRFACNHNPDSRPITPPLPTDSSKDLQSLRIRVVEQKGPGQWLVPTNSEASILPTVTSASNVVVTGASRARVQISASKEELELFDVQTVGDGIEIAATISAL